MLNGRKTIERLAEEYPQLYLIPGEDGAEQAYRDAALRGIFPEKNSLLHFCMTENDSLETVETPAGPVDVLTLCDRRDFEMFLRIMAKRCTVAGIPLTQGAVTLDGIANWRKIYAHRDAFFEAQRKAGISRPDWGTEFKRFTSDRKNYLDTLIVLAEGPYSGVPAEKAGFAAEEWNGISGTIRLYHECTHVICRRLYPGQIDAVWDELVADAVGIFAALGYFDRSLEERFLGIENGIYTGGRLQNYAEKLSGENEIQDAAEEMDAAEKLHLLARKCSETLHAFETILPTHRPAMNAGKGYAEGESTEAFSLIPLLEEKQSELWS